MKLVYFYKELKSMSPYRQMGEGMAELRSILHSYKHRKIRWNKKSLGIEPISTRIQQVNLSVWVALGTAQSNKRL